MLAGHATAAATADLAARAPVASDFHGEVLGLRLSSLGLGTYLGSPDGETDADNVELYQRGTVREFDFEPKDHVTLGLDLGIVDFQRSSKIAGSQTYILLREGALLELAVLRLALDHIVEQVEAKAAEIEAAASKDAAE